MPRLASWLLILPAVLLFAGCDEDNGGGGGSDRVIQTPEASLDNLWPDDDGNSWFHDYAFYEATAIEPPLSPDPESVPASPSLDVALAFFADEPLAGDEVATGLYAFGFRGEGTTESGASGPVLVSSLYSGPELAAGAASTQDPMMRWVARLRPDLLPVLRARGVELELPKQGELFRPLLLGDGIWHRDAASIGYYNNLDLEPRLRLAEADLTPGHEWTVQLIPELTDDVFLHARVLAEVRRKTPMGTFDSVVPIFYYIELGVVTYYDDALEIIGYARSVAAARIEYAPGTGPAHWHEWHLAHVDEDGEGNPILLPAVGENEGWLTRAGRLVPDL